MSKMNTFFRNHINLKNQKRIQNKEFSLLCNNCNGALILHDLGLKFRSPFVNLWMPPKDFIEYLEHLEHYRDIPIEFINDDIREYPVGVLRGVKEITVYFQHYKTEEEAAKKWRERSKRINLDNLFIILVERDGCTYDDLKRFDSLSIYSNKVVFTHKEYPEFVSAYYIPGFEHQGYVGDLWKYKNRMSGKRIYDEFPYVKWFNKRNLESV